MGCSESKNVVDPDSKKPEEKNAIVPGTVSSKNAKIETDETPEATTFAGTKPIIFQNGQFPEINLTVADFAPEHNEADLSPVFCQKEENRENSFNPQKRRRTLDTP